MKRDIFRLSVLLAFVIAGFSACQDDLGEPVDNLNLDEVGDFEFFAITENVESAPISNAGVTPFIIPGENQGGNRTCEEVALAFDLDGGFEFSSDKVDYNGSFSGAFPQGLSVSTNGTYVWFTYESNEFCVGAVIVKGSNEANVYYYEGGIKSDYGLAAPLNASGNPAGLSNITFCFVRCDTPPPPPLCDWIGETAFGGDTEGEGSAWWFAFDTKGPAVQSIYAGQKLVEGAFVEYDADNDVLTIELGPKLRLETLKSYYHPRTEALIEEFNAEPVKVQGYEELPESRPAAGLLSGSSS